MKTQTVELDTPNGKAIAIKDGQCEPWVIAYPTGDDRYYGTLSQVKARMKKRIAEELAEDLAREKDMEEDKQKKRGHLLFLVRHHAS